ncbi:MAG TPA: HD domain-containing phosphohydrolase [Solirubrobacteraceae bacterium]|nr:HD domain-containing phosphohydrolase [Solirubrobacteraceae bacterium]
MSTDAISATTAAGFDPSDAIAPPSSAVILIGAWLVLNFLAVPALLLIATRRRAQEPAGLRRARLVSAEAYVSILPSRLIVQACRILGVDRACLLVGADDGGLIVVAAHGMGEEVIGERTAIGAAVPFSASDLSSVNLGRVLPGTDLGDGIAVPVRTTSGRVVVLCAQPASRMDARKPGEHRLLTELTTLVAAAIEDVDPNAGFVRAVRACVHGLTAVDRSGDSRLRRAPIDLVSTAGRIGTRLGLDRSALIELELAACVYEISALTSVPVAGVDPETGDATWFSGPDPGEMAVRVGRFPGFESVALVAGLLGERWDGRGYPHELRGEKIPLATRILAVCGAAWTLTSNPPEGAGAPVESAIRCVQAASGTVFDPTVVMALSDELMGEIPRVGDRVADEWARADALYSVVE